MKTNKILVLLWVLFLSLSIFMGCKSKSTNSTGNEEMKSSSISEDNMEKGEFDIEEGQYYRVVVNHDTCFAFVEKNSRGDCEGYFYLVEENSDCASKHQFSVDVRWKTTTVTVDGESYDLKVKSSVLKHMLDWNRHIVSAKDESVGYNIEVCPYVVPDFFSLNDDNRYKSQPIYKVKETDDVRYGSAMGYWVSMSGYDDDGYAKIVAQCITKSLKKKLLPLDMDIYSPSETISKSDTLSTDLLAQKKPLIMFIHGGAFYVGDKSDIAIKNWCMHFASIGYVCASINYRMGCLPSKNDIERAGYMAVQDAHAALRFLVSNADKYEIDTNRIFIAGCSAGSITALNLAFMTEANRPKATFGKGKDNDTNSLPTSRTDDLGSIASSGNKLKNSFHIRAIVNMWGAINDIEMLRNSKTDVLSFHGDADVLVPYDQGYPFADMKGNLGQKLFGKMYGSASIDRKLKELGRRTQLYDFIGQGHGPQYSKGHSINQGNFNIIRDTMTNFLYKEMVPIPARIRRDNYDNRLFYVGSPFVRQINWKVDGGFILKAEGNKIWIVWKSDSPFRYIFTSGKYDNGILFHVEDSFGDEINKREQ